MQDARRNRKRPEAKMAITPTSDFSSEAPCPLRRGDPKETASADEAPEECFLLGAAREGSSNALGVLLDRHIDIITAYVATKVPSDDVSDVVQNVMAAAIAAIPQLETCHCRCCCSLLVTVTARRVADYHRRRRSEGDIVSLPSIMTDSSATEALRAIDLRMELEPLLAELSLEQRRALVLHSGLGETFQEVAEDLSTTAEAQRSLFRRAIERLSRLRDRF